jgi:hypothetical protein
MKLKLDPKADKNCKQCLGTGEKMTMSLFSLPALKHYPCDCLKEGK